MSIKEVPHVKRSRQMKDKKGKAGGRVIGGCFGCRKGRKNLGAPMFVGEPPLLPPELVFPPRIEDRLLDLLEREVSLREGRFELEREESRNFQGLRRTLVDFVGPAMAMMLAQAAKSFFSVTEYVRTQEEEDDPDSAEIPPAPGGPLD